MATEYTYVMASTEIKVRVKIGKSKSPTKRLTSLQTGSGEKLFLVGVSDKHREDALHYKYRKYHSNGEWFDLPLDDLLELVRDISHPLAFAKKQEGIDSSFDSINNEVTTKEPVNSTMREPFPHPPYPPHPGNFDSINDEVTTKEPVKSTMRGPFPHPPYPPHPGNFDSINDEVTTKEPVKSTMRGPFPHPPYPPHPGNFDSINDEVTTKEPVNSTMREPFPYHPHPGNFDLKRFDGDVYIVTGSNPLKNFLIKLESSGRVICDNYFCQQSIEVKPLSAGDKVVAKEHGLLVSQSDSVKIKGLYNCELLLAKFKAIMSPVFSKPELAPKPFISQRSHSEDSVESIESSELPSSAKATTTLVTPAGSGFPFPRCKGFVAIGNLYIQVCPRYAEIRGYCKMHLNQESVSVESELNNLTVTAPKPTKRLIFYDTVSVSPNPPLVQLIDLRYRFMDFYFSIMDLIECRIPDGMVRSASYSSRDMDNAKSTMVKRAIENFGYCNALERLSPLLMKKITESYHSRPVNDIFKKHSNLLVSAGNFRQAIVDYFQPQWDKLDLTGPGNLDLDLAANIANKFLQYFRPLSLIKDLDITVNCGHEHEDPASKDNSCLYSALIRNQYGRPVIVKELTVALSSFFGLTPKTLTDLTTVNDPVKAVEKLVFYHGRVLLDMSDNTSILTYSGYDIVSDYAYDTKVCFIRV